MPSFEGVKAWIEVDGAPLEEFKVEVDEGKRLVHCHVPSEAGKEFAVHWTWRRACDSRGWLTVDGRKRSHPVGGRGSVLHTFMDTMSIPDRPDLRAKLKFGNILTTDDESESLQDEHLVKALGSIELTVETGSFRQQLNASNPPRPVVASNTVPAKVLSQPKPIYERMKKAGSHQVVLGEIRRTAPIAQFEPDGSEPVHFVFVYQSKDVLRAQGIMPPAARPVVRPTEGRHTVTKPQDQGDSAEEDERRLRTLEEQAAAIKEQEAAIKEQEAAIKERAAAIKERAAAVKEQAAAVKERLKRKSDGGERGVLKRLKVEEIDARSAFQPGEVIDLCDD